MLTRIYTDIAAAALPDLIADIQADGGTFEQVAQADGNLTVTASFARLNPPPEDPPAAGAEFPWMPIARHELGVAEGHNPRITEYFKTTTLGAQPDTVPWCSAFVNFCVTQGHVAGTNSALARSWLNWGDAADDFVPGCVVVLARGGPSTGHVGFYVGRDGADRIQLLGGNQHDAVNTSSFDASTVIGKRVARPAMLAAAGQGAGAGARQPAPPAPLAAPAAAAPAPGGGGAQTPLSPNASIDELARRAFDFFVQTGWSAAQAAGLIGNIEAESNFKAHGPAGDSGLAIGLCQWHPDRQQKFPIAFPGRSIANSTYDEQLQFINFELLDPRGGEGAAAGHLKGAQTAQQAGGIVSQFYERPRDTQQNIQLRGQLAVKWFGKFVA